MATRVVIVAGGFWAFYRKVRRATEILLDDGTLALTRKVGRLILRILKGEENVVTWLLSDIRRGRKHDDIRWTTEIQTLAFPKIDHPKTSIVIPLFNKTLYTFNCLKSLLENTGDVPYEIIVVDDASTDDTPAMLSQVANIKIVRMSQNAGFLASCHAGAEVAKGRYLVFLNNDTQVRRGWLSSLISPMESDPSVGLVGAKLVYPDGNLQEAGGIIWNDASGWNYGRSDDPDKPEYNFVREVDYCSGACITVRRDLWEQLGGFDKRYSPAYYEDTDLAFAIREAGYKVIYQPKAEVVHHEGVSHGIELSTGIKRFQTINREKFRDKWRSLLVEKLSAIDENLLLARDRRRGRRVLVVDHQVPAHDRDSGSNRMFQLLGFLGQLGYVVTFLPANLAKTEPYTSELQQMGIEVLYGPCRVKDYLYRLGPHLNLVVIARPEPGKQYLKLIRRFAPRAKFIYDTVDLYFLRESRRAALEKSRFAQRKARNYKRLELSLATATDATLVVSPVERDILLQELPNLKVYVIPNIHEVSAAVRPFADRSDLLFVGGFQHSPNEDGVRYFIKEVFPLIKKTLPEVKLYIVGSDPTPAVKKLERSDVIVTGWIKDIAPFFGDARVFVAPLRYGAGVKGKIGQSLSYGLPVVTTSIGAEGMELTDGRNVLIANGEEDFAQKVIRLYTDAALWQDLSANALDYIRQHCTPEIMGRKIRSMLIEVTGETPRPLDIPPPAGRRLVP